jgi:hypothetical protein
VGWWAGRSGSQAYELLVHLIRIQWCSVLLGEDEVVVVVVGRPPGKAFAGLLPAPCSKYLYRPGVQVDDTVLAVAGLRLGAVLGLTS